MGFKVANYSITGKKIIITADCPVKVRTGMKFVSCDTTNNIFTVLASLGERTITLIASIPITGVRIGTQFEDR